MQTVTINNKKWPVNFGTAAIIRVEQLTGFPFYDLLISILEKKSGATNEVEAGINVVRSAGVETMVNLLYGGIYGGCLKAGKEAPEMQDLINDLDEDENMFAILVQVLGYAFQALPKSKGEEKKRTKSKEA